MLDIRDDCLELARERIESLYHVAHLVLRVQVDALGEVRVAAGDVNQRRLYADERAEHPLEGDERDDDEHGDQGDDDGNDDEHHFPLRDGDCLHGLCREQDARKRAAAVGERRIDAQVGFSLEGRLPEVGAAAAHRADDVRVVQHRAEDVAAHRRRNARERVEHRDFDLVRVLYFFGERVVHGVAADDRADDVPVAVDRLGDEQAERRERRALVARPEQPVNRVAHGGGAGEVGALSFPGEHDTVAVGDEQDVYAKPVDHVGDHFVRRLAVALYQRVGKPPFLRERVRRRLDRCPARVERLHNAQFRGLQLLGNQVDDFVRVDFGGNDSDRDGRDDDADCGGEGNLGRECQTLHGDSCVVKLRHRRKLAFR